MRGLGGVRHTATLAAWVALGTAFAGCDGDVSRAEEQYVIASMPAEFESFAMYRAIDARPVPAEQAAEGHQGCQAIVRGPSGQRVREDLVLDANTEPSFDLDATRSTDGWRVSSESFTLIGQSTAAFHSRLVGCISAIRDRYRSQPEGL